MPVEYLFEDLDDVPSIGYVEHKMSKLAGVSYHQASYHTDDKWLKVWFGGELTTEQQALLAQYVNESLGKKGFSKITGRSFHEFEGSGKRWQKHRLRLDFKKQFISVPEVSFTNARFDGAADIEVLSTDTLGLDFQVTSTSPKAKSKFNSVDFEWEAVSWVA